MPSNSIPHYLYKRNHTWWFRKRFVSEGNAIEYRLSLQTASFQRARLLALRLETLCQQMVASLGGPKNKKSSMMNKTTTELISAKLRAKVAEWTAEETERWFCKPTRDEGDLNDFLETLDMVVSDLKERITYDDKPSLHQAEANTVLNELPHLNAMLSDYDYQIIARMVAEAKVKSLQDTRAIILGKSADWLSAPTIQKAQTDDVEVHLLSEMIEKYQAENEEKEHVEKTQGKYAHSLALTISFFGDVPVSKITVSDGRAFRELLTTLPDGLTTKEMLKTPLHQLISDKKFVKTIGTTTANDHLMKVRRFFNGCLIQVIYLMIILFLKSNCHVLKHSTRRLGLHSLMKMLSKYSIMVFSLLIREFMVKRRFSIHITSGSLYFVYSQESAQTRHVCCM